MTSKRKPKVIGIILTYNCADLLINFYKKIPKHIFDKIILVDDGSTDDTLQKAKELQITSFPHRHLGYGGNIKYGLKKAHEMGADYMVEIHGDGQYDVKVIPTALKKIEKKGGLLLGSRFFDLQQPLRDGMPLPRYLGNIVLSFFCRYALGVQLTEFHTGFHIYSKEFVTLAGFKNTSNGHIYSLEIIAQACFKKIPMCEIPIRCDYKTKHTSINMKKSVIYTFQSFVLLGYYLLAKAGFKFGVFKPY